MGQKFRDKQNSVIQYNQENLESFRLLIPKYTSEYAEHYQREAALKRVNLEQDTEKVILDIFEVIGEDDIAIRSDDWTVWNRTVKERNLEDGGLPFNFSLDIEFLDIVDVFALESFLAFLRKLGFDIGEFDGEEWDTPGYASYVFTFLGADVE